MKRTKMMMETFGAKPCHLAELRVCCFGRNHQIGRVRRAHLVDTGGRKEVNKKPRSEERPGVRKELHTENLELTLLTRHGISCVSDSGRAPCVWQYDDKRARALRKEKGWNMQAQARAQEKEEAHTHTHMDTPCGKNPSKTPP